MKTWHQFVIFTDFRVFPDCFGPSVLVHLSHKAANQYCFPQLQLQLPQLRSQINPKFWFDCCSFCTCSMILMNYLNEMSHNDKSELVGVMAVSIPWNCMESCVSLEEPINSFLFNKHLTRNLVNMLNRYLTVVYMNKQDCAKKINFFRPALKKLFFLTPHAPQNIYFYSISAIFISSKNFPWKIPLLLAKWKTESV